MGDRFSSPASERMRVVVGINVLGGGSLVDSQALEAESGVDDQLPLHRGIQDNFAQHCEFRRPTDSMKDSTQKERTEKESG